MAKTVNLYQAKTQLSKLVDEASAGQEVIIAKAGRPKARLVPLGKAKPNRKPGALKGQIWTADDFDDELPAEILEGFLGEDDHAGDA